MKFAKELLTKTPVPHAVYDIIMFFIWRQIEHTMGLMM